VLKINFKAYNFNTKKEEGNALIFDIIRKKYVRLTPEEWVRQHVIMYLIEEKGFPKGLISVEKSLKYNGLTKRFDICVAARTGEMILLVECKSPNVQISQATIRQAGIYQKTLGVNYILISNGLVNVYMNLKRESNAFEFIPELPHYSELI
jgi:predicted type IV restriction endonuclease